MINVTYKFDDIINFSIVIELDWIQNAPDY